MNEPEFDADLYGPQIKVFVLVDADLAGAADLFHVERERVADFLDKRVELWLPLISYFFDLVIEFGEGVLDLREPGGQNINLLLPLFILSNHTLVTTFMHKLQPRFLAFNLVLELLWRLASWLRKEEASELFYLGHNLLTFLESNFCSFLRFYSLSGQGIDLSLLVLEELFYGAVSLTECFEFGSRFYEHYLSFVKINVSDSDYIDGVL